MNAKKCARPECGKTVYPLEELKCLDKTWHKGCFKCTVCGMTLSMKNYKGYNKMPYCEPHYPKTVASVVADTPEMRRLAENTKIQSQIPFDSGQLSFGSGKFHRVRGIFHSIRSRCRGRFHQICIYYKAHYHAEFEKMKGNKITVADDPEVLRNMKNTKVISNVEYHGDLEKREHMERIRPPLQESTNPVHGGYQPGLDAFNYGGGPPAGPANGGAMHSSQYSDSSYGQQQRYSSYESQYVPGNSGENGGSSMNMMKANGHHNGDSAVVDGLSSGAGNNGPVASPYTAKMQQTSTLIYSSDQGGRVNPQPARTVGSIADYDPMNGNWGTGRNDGQPQQHQHQRAPQQQQQQQPQQPQRAPQQQEHHQQSQRAPTTYQPSSQQQQQQQASSVMIPPPKQQQQQTPVASSGGGQQRGGPYYRAMYDYTAADTDEVTFVEGDVIGGCELVDEGWMTGTVQRTKQWGMLPANYVERVN